MQITFYTCDGCGKQGLSWGEILQLEISSFEAHHSWNGPQHLCKGCWRKMLRAVGLKMKQA